MTSNNINDIPTMNININEVYVNNPPDNADVDLTAAEEVVESNEDGLVGNGVQKRGSGFTKTEDLLICKAFIAASEDSQTAAYQKASVFKIKMWQCYTRLLEEQERMDCVRVNGMLKDNLLPVYDCQNGNTLLWRVKDNDRISLISSKPLL
jgi:hypothetical protein